MKAKNRHFGMMAAAMFAATASLGLASSQYMDVPGHRVAGEMTKQEYADMMVAQYHALSKHAMELGDASIMETQPSEEDLETLFSPDMSDSTGLQNRRKLIGVGAPLGMTVDLSTVDSAAVDSTPTPLAGGFLRRDADGTMVWYAHVRSRTAGGMRLHFTDFDLPEGASLWLYNGFGESEGPYTGHGVMDAQDFWGAPLGGESQFLELRIAPGTDLSSAYFKIPEITHIDAPSFDQYKGVDMRAHCPGNDTCVNNAACYDTTDWAEIDDVADAVAGIVFNVGPSSFVCSGGLVADTHTGSDIPYFITANHCFDTQASATSATFRFQYRRAGCATTCSVGSTNRTGATLLFTSPSSNSPDLTFLRLNQTPPTGSFFLGYNTSPVHSLHGHPLHRISHPNGAPQAYTEHTVDASAITQCFGSTRPATIYSADTEGATEGGSSGSVVCNASGQIVGHLTGCCPSLGGADCGDVCNASNRTIDPAFAQYYSSISAWLDPDPVTVTINQGAGQADPVLAMEDFPITFDVTFSEAVSGFAFGDITFGGTATVSGGTVSPLTPSASYTVSIPFGSVTNGTLTASIGAGAANSTFITQITNEASTSTDNSITISVSSIDGWDLH